MQFKDLWDLKWCTFLLLLFTFKETIKWLLQTIDKHKGIYNKWFHKIKNKTHHKSFFLAKIWYEYPLNEWLRINPMAYDGPI